MKKFYIAKSRRLRGTPYSNRIENQGLTTYTVYNHMLLPAGFEGLEKEYFHLKEHVQVWDVAAERQVQIAGKDSTKLVQLMTCRNLSKSKVGRCYYAPIIDEQGKMINDPIILKLDENKWWLSLADSDVGLYAKGIASGLNLKVEITEPDVNILAVQGPKSFKLMEKIFGEAITKLKFFGFNYFDFKGTKHLIAQSGWSKQGGYEIYVENIKSGLELYDHLFETGKEFDVKPGCPNLIERIESALLSYGNDMDINDNPLECGFDKFVNIDSDVNFLGKENLKKIKSEGIKKRLMGVQIEAKEINVTGSITLKDENNIKIGELRSGCYSPYFGKVIGIAMIKKPFWKVSQTVKIEINGNSFDGKVCYLPFI